MRLLSIASDPPLRTRAFPLLRASPAICTRASGRDSKIIAITPIGVVRWVRVNPSSSSRRFRTVPTGVTLSSDGPDTDYRLVPLRSIEGESLVQRGGESRLLLPKKIPLVGSLDLVSAIGKCLGQRLQGCVSSRSIEVSENQSRRAGCLHPGSYGHTHPSPSRSWSAVHRSRSVVSSHPIHASVIDCP
jgi:hypothetical protein